MSLSDQSASFIKEHHHRFHFFFVLIIATAISFGFLYLSIIHPIQAQTSYTPPIGIPNPGNWFLSTTGSITDVTTGGTSRTFTGTGTATNTIIFRGIGNPTFTGTVVISGSYVIVENIIVTNGGVVRFTGNHGVLRNSEVMNNNRSISSLTVGVGGSSDTVIYNNRIHDNGDWQSSAENDVHGIGGGGPTQRIWILENEMYHHGGDSIQFGHAGGNQVSGVYIGRNIMHHDRENAVDIKEASNFVVSENTMYGYRTTSSSEGAAVVVHYCPINSHIINNDIYDSQIGISSSGLTTACDGINPASKFMGNMIHDIFGNGFQGWGSSKITNIVDNTFYNIGGTGADLTNAYAGSSIENNIFRNVTGTDIVVAGGNVTERSNLADTVDPLFVNPAANDFHLQSTSPAIDTGVVSSVYADHQNIYGVAASFDRD